VSRLLPSMPQKGTRGGRLRESTASNAITNALSFTGWTPTNNISPNTEYMDTVVGS